MGERDVKDATAKTAASSAAGPHPAGDRAPGPDLHLQRWIAALLTLASILVFASAAGE